MTAHAKQERTLRVLYWLAALSANSVLYYSAQWSNRTPYILAPSQLDIFLGTTTSATAVMLYLSFFILIGFSFLSIPLDRARRLALAIMVSSVIAFGIFMLWPTCVERPTAPISRLYLVLQTLDQPVNCLPSLHGAITMLCVTALWSPSKKRINYHVLLWGIAILWTAVTLRQHLFLDIAAGISLGIIVGKWFDLQARSYIEQLYE